MGERGGRDQRALLPFFSDSFVSPAASFSASPSSVPFQTSGFP